MMEYTVLRPLRWNKKNLKRNSKIIPTTRDEEFRCNQLVATGILAAEIEGGLLSQLQAAGIDMGRVRSVAGGGK
jgi:hypothetical protein